MKIELVTVNNEVIDEVTVLEDEGALFGAGVLVDQHGRHFTFSRLKGDGVVIFTQVEVVMVEV